MLEPCLGVDCTADARVEGGEDEEKDGDFFVEPDWNLLV